MAYKIRVIKSGKIYPNKLTVLKGLFCKEIFSMEVGLNPDLTSLFEKQFFIKLVEGHLEYNDISREGISFIQLDLETYDKLKKAKDYLLMHDLFKKNIKKFLEKLAENTFDNVKVAYFGVKAGRIGIPGKHVLTINGFGKIRFRTTGLHGIIKEETNIRKKSGGCVRMRGEDILKLNEYVEVGKTILKITTE